MRQILRLITEQGLVLDVNVRSIINFKRGDKLKETILYNLDKEDKIKNGRR